MNETAMVWLTLLAILIAGVVAFFIGLGILYLIPRSLAQTLAGGHMLEFFSKPLGEWFLLDIACALIVVGIPILLLLAIFTVLVDAHNDKYRS